MDRFQRFLRDDHRSHPSSVRSCPSTVRSCPSTTVALPTNHAVSLRSYGAGRRRRPCRWNHMQKQMRKTGINQNTVQRFEAVDGKQIIASNKVPSEEDYSRTWDSTKNCDYHSVMTPRLCMAHPGECGQALSHIALWRKIVASQSNDVVGVPKGILILEDDSVFIRDFAPRLKETLRAGSEMESAGWDILYLASRLRRARRAGVCSSAWESDSLQTQLWLSNPCLRDYSLSSCNTATKPSSVWTPRDVAC